MFPPNFWTAPKLNRVACVVLGSDSPSAVFRVSDATACQGGRGKQSLGQYCGSLSSVFFLSKCPDHAPWREVGEWVGCFSKNLHVMVLLGEGLL